MAEAATATAEAAAGATTAEFELIELLRRRIAEAGLAGGAGITLGSGDDAAVLEGNTARAISVDAVVEGVHFRRETASLQAIGGKALAAALSDLAAMGAGSGEALIVLGIPPDLGEEGCLELADGLVALAAANSVSILGGDVSASPVLFVSVTVLGPLASSAGAVRRDGARPGDVVVVTGELGGAAAGRLILEREGLAARLAAPLAERLRERQLAPRPRLAAGRALAQAGASAMIDLSDGLAGDARHVAAASEALLTVELERLPVAEGVNALADAAGLSPHELAAAGGEDYELLATLAPAALEEARAVLARSGVPLSFIGEVTAGPPGLELIDGNGGKVELEGFDQLAD